ncbi:MAG: alanine dehydrogenase [Pseudomonadota bacterium]|uniref:alanine dehydrogenase n=1 Tax=Phenylobacterium sp. TaxID=1871053 RepID=UPI0025EBD2BC|nr:alanine dehydrogenase [Phenylobacterium sp.]MBT9470609.1 alanine dehydrogenase [Phenylobacterium sp.]
MRIGVPKEIKTLEFRVGLTPGAVESLTARGHEVFVETNAGAGVGLTDEAYQAAGATVLATADEVFAAAEMIVKVKEPQAIEVARLKPHHILFTYLHLAADKAQAIGLMKSGCTAIAYETVTDSAGRLPLLAPMSQVAGRMAVDVGANALLRPSGGRGLLLGGVPGVPAAKVAILGGGVSGQNAAEMAVGHRADVTIFDVSAARLAQLDAQFGGRVKTAFATRDAVSAAVYDADLVLGCVLVAGAAAPKLVTRADLSKMRKGSVLVDVSIDQGGCFETSRATTHADPIYEVDGIVHYCVANMPGAAPYTSTFALGASTIPYVRALADKGVDAAFADDAGLAAGLNVRDGKITYRAVAQALDL